MPGIQETRWRSELIRYMARVDLETALRWFAETDSQGNGTIRIETAKQMAARGVEQALIGLAELDDELALQVLRRLLCQLRSSSPEYVLRYAAEAVVRARGMAPRRRFVWNRLRRRFA
jgi:hypothetical protein